MCASPQPLLLLSYLLTQIVAICIKRFFLSGLELREGYLGCVFPHRHKWRLRHSLGDGFQPFEPLRGYRREEREFFSFFVAYQKVTLYSAVTR